MRLTLSPLFLCLALAACAGQASPEDAQMSSALAAQGKALLVQGKNVQALDIYKSAIEHDDNNARAWNGLGAAYDLLGQKEQARDAFEHAVDLAPDDVGAVNNVAHAEIEQGDFDSALHLLAPYASKPDAPLTLKQNWDIATRMAHAKEAAASNVYADLGAYPTQGMARGHLAEVKKLLGSDADKITMSIVPEIKVTGGTPVFTIKATGKDPQDICDTLNAEAFPCVPVGK